MSEHKTGELYRDMKNKMIYEQWDGYLGNLANDVLAALNDAYKAGVEAAKDDGNLVEINKETYGLPSLGEFSNISFEFDGNKYFISHDNDARLFCQANVTLIKPKQPEVFDADGNKIEIGMTVYSLTGEEHYVVEGFGMSCNDEWWLVIKDDKTGIKCHVDPECYVIEKPIFDVNNVRIKVGDTVWYVNGWDNERKYVVTEIDYEYNFIYTESGSFIPDELTHEPIDTQERIDEDAKKTIQNYWSCLGKCNECPCIVDGKKPYERYDTNGYCMVAKTMDLLERQRKLDAKKGM